MDGRNHPKSLSDDDRRKLIKESAIDPEMVDLRGYWTATRPEELADLGFAPHQCELVPALVIPEFSTAGFQTSHMIRPHKPRLNEKGQPIKYEKPLGSSPMVDAGPNNTDLRNPKIPIVITEGSKKRDALACLGFCAISIPGVFGFMSKKTVIPDFDDIDFHGRPVILSFDSDVMTKSTVAHALSRLTATVKRRGAKSVRASYLPDHYGGAKMGVDDFFALGKTSTDFMATVREIHNADALVIETADDVTEQQIVGLEAKVRKLEEELHAERADRAEERRILGDSRRPAQERIAAVIFRWEASRVAQHGSGKMGRGSNLDPVTAVDETGAILTSVKRMAEISGTSPKNMGDYFAKWQSEGLIDRSVTRIRIGESANNPDGEIRPMFESTARIRPRNGDMGGFLHELYMAAPTPKPRVKRAPTYRCADHPDADIIRRTTNECSVCHEEVAPERVSRHAAGTPPDVQEQEARNVFWLDAESEPQNAPEVIPEEPLVNTSPSSAPSTLLSHRRLFLNSSVERPAPFDRYTDAAMGRAG